MRRLGKLLSSLLAMLVIAGVAPARGSLPNQDQKSSGQTSQRADLPSADDKSTAQPARTPDGKPGEMADSKSAGTADGKSAQDLDAVRLAITRDVMDEFTQGSLAAVRERFDSDLKGAISESDVQDAHDQLFEIAGAFVSQLSQAARLSQGAHVYIARSQCARYQVELRLSFDDADRITDFRIGPVSSLSAESMEAAARDVADLLEKGQFADANAKFNARLKGNMPADRLDASWTHVQQHLGAFKSIQSARKDPDLDRVDVRCEFERGPIIVRLAFDPAGKVSGLWMLPAETEKDSQI